MDTLRLGDRLHSPGKGVGQTVFYKETRLAQWLLAAKFTSGCLRTVSNCGVGKIKYEHVQKTFSKLWDISASNLFFCMTWELDDLIRLNNQSLNQPLFIV